MDIIRTWCYILTSAGLHNIIVLTVVSFITIQLLRYIRKKQHVVMKWLLIIAIICNCMFCFYSFLSLRGSVRLFIACSGHPIVAYTLSDENIVVKGSDYSYNVYVKTQIKDEYGIPYLGPYWIRISKIGVVYFAYIQGA